MEFELNRSIEILSSTPKVFTSLLGELSENWVHQNEGNESWSPYQIIAHLIHMEKVNWPVRIKVTLENKNIQFEPFERLPDVPKGSRIKLSDLLAEFKKIREENISTLLNYEITQEMLTHTAIHPAFGIITLKQLLSTWVVHDLGHIAQASRVLAKQYKDETGPWIEYLPILTR